MARAIRAELRRKSASLNSTVSELMLEDPKSAQEKERNFDGLDLNSAFYPSPEKKRSTRHFSIYDLPCGIYKTPPIHSKLFDDLDALPSEFKRVPTLRCIGDFLRRDHITKHLFRHTFWS